MNFMAAEFDLAISGMTCASCVARVEKSLNKIPGVNASVNLALERAHVVLAPEAENITPHELIKAVDHAGYTARLLEQQIPEVIDVGSEKRDVGSEKSARELYSSAARRESARAGRAGQPSTGRGRSSRARALFRRFLLAFLCSIPVVSISMLPSLQFPAWQWWIAAPALVVGIYCAWPFHASAYKGLIHGNFTMDTLVSLGVIASLIWSIWALLFGGAGEPGYHMHMHSFHQISGAAHIYFESAAMIVVFLLLGRWLEARAQHHAGDALRELLSLGADHALLLKRAGDESSKSEKSATGEQHIPKQPHGAHGADVTRSAQGTQGSQGAREIPVHQLLVGDIFRVRPGEQVATDGVVVAGQSAIDASMITGESAPVDVAQGSYVHGATVNTYGTIDVQATRVGEQTTLATMGRLLIQAQAGKAPVQRLADKISAVFVPGVLLLAFIDCVVRLALGMGMESALRSAVTVLVVACPCALGLATPTALLVGSGAASKRGIFLSGPQALEKAYRVSCALLDKTGTLTSGKMSVVSIGTCNDVRVAGQRVAGQRDAVEQCNEREQSDPAEQSDAAGIFLQCALSLEALSDHPLAHAIVAYGRERGISEQKVENFINYPGKGVQGIIAVEELVQKREEAGKKREKAGEGKNSEEKAEGRKIARAGTYAWLRECGLPVPPAVREAVDRMAYQGITPVLVAYGHQVLGWIALADTLRSGSSQAVCELQKMGIEVLIISGDDPRVAQKIGEDLGAQAQGGMLPSDKVRCVREHQSRGERVMMVGDGVNDSAALAAADCSIALGTGADVAKASADITLMHPHPQLIPLALRMARRTLRIIKQNLAWAFAYNIVAIPLALAGFIAPGLAAAAMASSSLIVVSNSLRLRSMASMSSMNSTDSMSI